jgi:hypothetical protein
VATARADPGRTGTGPTDPVRHGHHAARPHQVKLTRSFRPEQWLADADGPDRDERTSQALAEAAALVAHGRSRPGRQALAKAIHREPALAEPWLRGLVTALNSSG